MKTLTIIPGDNMVYIDKVARRVDCSAVDEKIHAIQFNAERRTGHIEYVDEDHNDGQRDPNETIEDIALYQHLIDAWERSA